MNFLFLAEAASEQAQENAQGSTPGTLLMLGFWVVVIVILYFLMIRPQKKKQQEEDALRNSVEVGDDITTIGGIVGKVIAVRDDDETIVIETGSDKSRIRFKKWAIRSIDTPDKQVAVETKKDKKEGKSKKNKKAEGEAAEPEKTEE